MQIIKPAMQGTRPDWVVSYASRKTARATELHPAGCWRLTAFVFFDSYFLLTQRIPIPGAMPHSRTRDRRQSDWVPQRPGECRWNTTGYTRSGNSGPRKSRETPLNAGQCGLFEGINHCRPCPTLAPSRFWACHGR